MRAGCAGPCRSAHDSTRSRAHRSARSSRTHGRARRNKVAVNWWHISTKDPGLSYWQKLADDYMAAHPNVDVKITVLENEAFKTKLSTVMQSGNPPDIFQSWGGGTMVEQAKAGLLKDITADLDADGGAWRNTFAPGALAVYSHEGKQYGVPWDMGMVGWWYNKDLFAKAGIQDTAKDLDRVPGRCEEAPGGRHHADRPGRKGQLDRHAHLVVPRDAHRWASCV